MLVMAGEKERGFVENESGPFATKLPRAVLDAIVQ